MYKDITFPDWSKIIKCNAKIQICQLWFVVISYLSKINRLISFRDRDGRKQNFLKVWIDETEKKRCILKNV
jgi:hypothetical protein